MDYLGAGAALASGTLSYLGAREANSTNRKIARDQMAFQERMSSTAHQRAMQDMRAAGLNPILAANHGGASAPPGSSAGQQVNELSGAVSSAMDTKRLAAEIDNLKQQNLNLKSQNEQIDSQTDLNKQLLQTNALKIPAIKTESEIDETPYGKAIRYLDRLNPFKHLFKFGK